MWPIRLQILSSYSDTLYSDLNDAGDSKSEIGGSLVPRPRTLKKIREPRDKARLVTLRNQVNLLKS